MGQSLCNDYFPRRLFVGPYRGRTGIDGLMLNGTGMVKLISCCYPGAGGMKALADVAARNGVPEAFFALAPWFDAPVISGTVPALPALDAEQMAAIEHLLWRWKHRLPENGIPSFLDSNMTQ